MPTSAVHERGGIQPAKRQPLGQATQLVPPRVRKLRKGTGCSIYRRPRHPAENSSACCILINAMLVTGINPVKNRKFPIKYGIREYSREKCPTDSVPIWCRSVRDFLVSAFIPRPDERFRKATRGSCEHAVSIFIRPASDDG